jgi:hypothetical protein
MEVNTANLFTAKDAKEREENRNTGFIREWRESTPMKDPA